MPANQDNYQIFSFQIFVGKLNEMTLVVIFVYLYDKYQIKRPQTGFILHFTCI